MFENGATPYSDKPFLTNLIKEHCPRGGRALDIGAGYGRDTLFMASELGCQVTAVEPTISGSKAISKAASPKVKVLGVAASEIPWTAGEKYDFILMDSVLQFIPESERGGVITNATQHLTSKGVCLIASHSDEHSSLVLPLLDLLPVVVKEGERTIAVPFEMEWEGESFEAAFHVVLVRRGGDGGGRGSSNIEDLQPISNSLPQIL